MLNDYRKLSKEKRRQMDEKLQIIAGKLKCLGHPIRLQIVDALRVEEPRTVTDLANFLDDPVEQSLLSHHLGKMRSMGILRAEKKGMFVFYSLEDRSVLDVFDISDIR